MTWTKCCPIFIAFPYLHIGNFYPIVQIRSRFARLKYDDGFDDGVTLVIIIWITIVSVIRNISQRIRARCIFGRMIHRNCRKCICEDVFEFVVEPIAISIGRNRRRINRRIEHNRGQATPIIAIEIRRTCTVTRAPVANRERSHAKSGVKNCSRLRIRNSQCIRTNTDVSIMRVIRTVRKPIPRFGIAIAAPKIRYSIHRRNLGIRTWIIMHPYATTTDAHKTILVGNRLNFDRSNAPRGSPTIVFVADAVLTRANALV